MTLVKKRQSKSVLRSIFRRRGGDGHFTRLFDELDHHDRSIVHNRVSLMDGEEFVISASKDIQNWLLLTTDRLVWSINGQNNEVMMCEIEDTSVNLNNMWPPGLRMHETTTIEVKVGNGTKYLVDIENGAPFSGVLSILNNVVHRNTHKKSRPI